MSSLIPSSRRSQSKRNLESSVALGIGTDPTPGDDDVFAEDCNNQHQPSPQMQAQPPQSSLAKSRFVLEALSDESSKLARFLFVGTDGGGVDDDDVESMPRMGDMEAAFMSLQLEPMHVRNERIALIFEAFAIFGALFMNGVWIIYEWGSSKGYGGDGTSIVAGRVFECLMALALVCNTLMAFWGAVFWMFSLFWNSSHEEFVFNSRKPLVYLITLMEAIPPLIMGGLFLGLYSNLAPNWPETIVCFVVTAIVVVAGLKFSEDFQLATAPLECYHAPTWLKSNMYHQLSFSRRAREDLKARARLRADKLRKRAYLARKLPDPESQANGNNNGAPSISPMGSLLRQAAMNLDRADSDISAYEGQLEKDWISKPEQLKGVGVDSLNRYMPFGLAREVHKLLETDIAP